jgi:hypothetical protein
MKKLAALIKYFPIPVCAALAAFFVYFPITDTDIFWHLAAGREILTHRHFLFSDPFSFTLDSPQWIDLHWLFQIIVYGLYLAAGLKAIIAFKLAVVAFVCIALCTIFRSARYIWCSGFLAALFFCHARYLVLDRPVLITMVCMAVYLFLFEKVRQGWNRNWLWLCVPLQIFWANSQGLYPIGLFIIGSYWCEILVAAAPPDPERKHFFSAPAFFALILFLCCLACVVTPYGINGLTLPFKIFSRIAPVAKNIYSLNISENVPLMSLTGFEAGYRILVILIAIIAFLLFALNIKRIRIAHILLFSGFLILAFIAVRNVLLYFLVMIPVISYGVMSADVVLRLGSRSAWTGRFLWTAAVLAGLSCLWTPVQDHWAMVRAYPPHRALSPFRFPEKITEYLKTNPVRGEMFNDIRYGGYLIWKLFPEKKVFIDGRLVIRSDRFFQEYLAICEQPDLFPQVAEKFNITHVILPSAIFDRYLRLIKWLYESSDWHCEFTDGTSFLFVRNDARDSMRADGSAWPAINLSDPAAVEAVKDGINAEWHDVPLVRREALEYFSDVLAYLGLNQSAGTIGIK